ncbi:MAG: ABC transporter ATP-binding protein/permease [Acholeplasmatales bacterium]|nr:ABC transporter ATP-binding protein/permease [Acholeplasmatales bacterium]
MLKLKNIKKTYVVTSELKVEALKGINLNFRKNEFVSILGPSGCGKTTMLNIIGGLDKYTDGDLVISGKSTKNFNDRDWDVYRNHRIGFIFQSYNLIPHQTILGNVELALTIGGISKEERQKKAKEALDKVGLSGQYSKKPNQLSGGQCQRVAIARALVNEPEILLADEPTGALDTVTSVQIMDLIKEISNEKLVIMVTHNPDLAEKYSSRIVRLLDGEVIEDSNPFKEEDEQKEVDEINNREKAEYEILTEAEKKTVKKQKNRAKMSFLTAFKLSARNLYSKLKRTIMVVIAGSIGIIGVSAVLAVSQGVRDYITNIQDDLLSGNPITIRKSGIDYETLMNSSSFQVAVQSTNQVAKNGEININSLVQYLVQNQKALDSLAYQNEFDADYVSYVLSMPKEYYNNITLKYGLSVDYNIYTEYKVSHNTKDPHYALKKEYDEEYGTGISLDSINQIYANTIGNILRAVDIEDSKVNTYSSLITSLTKPLAQTMNYDNNTYIKEQYDLVAGHYPTEKTGNEREILLVLDNDGMATDLMLAQLGYYSQEEFFDTIYDAINESNKDIAGKKDYPIYVNKADVRTSFTYDELLNKTFTWYPNNTVFKKKSGSEPKNHQFEYSYKEPTDKTNTLTLKVAGILKLKEGTSYGALSSGFLYSEATAKEMVKRSVNSDINEYIKARINQNGGNEKTSSITSTISYDLRCYWESIAQEGNEKGLTPGTISPFDGNLTDRNDTYNVVVGESDSTTNIMGLFTGGSSGAGFDMSDIYSLENLSDADKQRLIELMAYLKDPKQAGEFFGKVISFFSEKTAKYFSDMLTDKKLYVKTFGGSYLPNGINIYPTNFDIKSKVTEYLTAWNKIEGNDAKTVTFNTYNEDFSQVTGTKSLAPEERNEIKYNDPVGIIINLINTMIDIVTYALVAFTALSLVVSTVMIAIITYVSVMERVKEIGVIRSLGGRKKDVSHLFNAEAFIIGAISGIFGILITYVIQIFANILINIISGGIVTKIANLTPLTAIIMILVSILLTSISGLLPAKSAARKDPVVALRTE